MATYSTLKGAIVEWENILSGSEKLSSAWQLRVKEILVRLTMICDLMMPENDSFGIDTEYPTELLLFADTLHTPQFTVY